MRPSRVVFLVVGSEKAEILHAVLQGKSDPPYPAQLVQPRDRGQKLFLVDKAAAAIADAWRARQSRASGEAGGDYPRQTGEKHVILAGDIGGTKCNLALYEIHGNSHRKIIDQRYESRDFPTFDEMISKFLSETRAETKGAGKHYIEAAGFGVAGPVIDHRVKATNLALDRRCAQRLPSNLERRTLSC